MGPLVLAAATAVVTAMATDGWQAARRAMVTLWRPVRPQDVPAIESELDDTRAEITAAHRTGETPADESLVAYWQLKLQRLLNSSPRLKQSYSGYSMKSSCHCCHLPSEYAVQNIQNITASAPGRPPKAQCLAMSSTTG